MLESLASLVKYNYNEKKESLNIKMKNLNNNFRDTGQ